MQNLTSNVRTSMCALDFIRGLQGFLSRDVYDSLYLAIYFFQISIPDVFFRPFSKTLLAQLVHTFFPWYFPKSTRCKQLVEGPMQLKVCIAFNLYVSGSYLRAYNLN